MILLYIFLGLFIALMLFPSGFALSGEQANFRARIILAGLRFPVPSRLSKAAARVGTKRVNKWLDVQNKFEKIAKAGVKVTEEYGIESLPLLFKVGKRLIRTVHFKIKKLSLTIASFDPAFTGTWFGVANAISPALPAKIPFDLNIDFTTDTPQIEYAFTVTVIPAQMLFEAVRAFFTLRLWTWRHFNKEFAAAR